VRHRELVHRGRLPHRGGGVDKSRGRALRLTAGAGSVVFAPSRALRQIRAAFVEIRGLCGRIRPPLREASGMERHARSVGDPDRDRRVARGAPARTTAERAADAAVARHDPPAGVAHTVAGPSGSPRSSRRRSSRCPSVRRTRRRPV
jgi:hypothetical protein